jgi:hypothetical protein
MKVVRTVPCAIAQRYRMLVIEDLGSTPKGQHSAIAGTAAMARNIQTVDSLPVKPDEGGLAEGAHDRLAPRIRTFNEASRQLPSVIDRRVASPPSMCTSNSHSRDGSRRAARRGYRGQAKRPNCIPPLDEGHTASHRHRGARDIACLV